MKKISSYLLLAPALILITATSVQAHDSNIRTLAGIIMHLNHYPSSSEQDVLSGIAAGHHATAGEKILASALKHMQHRVSGSDAEKLHQLQSDASASKQEQALASILLGINHHSSDSDKQKLKSLLE